MGYYTNFTISIHRETVSPTEAQDNEQIFNEIEKKSGYTFNTENDTEAELNEATWKDAIEDVKTVAKKHPDVIIQLTGKGEDRNDNWCARFHGSNCEIIEAKTAWPEFEQIFLPDEASPKARYQRFQNALKAWLDFKAGLQNDILARLKDASIDLTEFDFGKRPYFFISTGESLFCHEAELDDDGNVVISAGPTADPDDVSFSLSIDDVMQDTVTLNDFMDCIYGNKDNCLDD